MEPIPLWQRDLLDGLARLQNNYTLEAHPDSQRAQEEYTVAIGDLELQALDRVADIDAAVRRVFTGQWLAGERLRLQREAHAATASVPDMEMQREIHAPYLRQLRELDDDTNKPYLKSVDYLASRANLETEIAERQTWLREQIDATNRALDERFGFAPQGATRSAADHDAFLEKIRSGQERERE